MNALKTFAADFKNLPPVIRGVMYLIGIGVLGISAYGIYQFVKDAKGKSADKEEANTVVDEVKHLENQGIIPSYPDSQYKSWANIILNALNATGGCFADPITVSSIIGKTKNDVDWLKLVNAFGIKEITGCGFVSNRQCTLQQGMNWKLERPTINILNNFFQNRGSKYRL